MGGDKGPRTQPWMAVNELDHSPGDGKPVVGAGASPDLVEDHQAAWRGVMEQVGCLQHLDHEGRLPGMNHVLGADAGEDSVDHSDSRGASGHKAAHLGHQHDQGHLPEVSGLARHVRAGDHPDALALLQHRVVRDETTTGWHELLHHRVAPLSDLKQLIFQ